MATVELRFSPLPAHVRTARLVAATLARRHGFDEAVVDEVKLAVGEACSRAVGLHAAHAQDSDVVVLFQDTPDQYVVTVRDAGPPGADTAIETTGTEVAELPQLIDVASLAAPADPPAATGPAHVLPPGVGLAIVAGLVDDLDVSRTDDGTAVRMSWAIKPAD
jgi:serine/threonine-protein kinase RsbW